MALKQNLLKDSGSVCLQHLTNQTTLLPPFVQIWDIFFPQASLKNKHNISRADFQTSTGWTIDYRTSGAFLERNFFLVCRLRSENALWESYCSCGNSFLKQDQRQDLDRGVCEYFTYGIRKWQKYSSQSQTRNGREGKEVHIPQHAGQLDFDLGSLGINFQVVSGRNVALLSMKKQSAGFVLLITYNLGRFL